MERNWNFNLLSDRLEWAKSRKEQRDGRTYSWAELGRQAGNVSSAAVSYWTQNTNGIYAVNARPLAEWLRVNALWLETGEGSPDDLTFPPETDIGQIKDDVARIAQIIDWFRDCDSQGRDFIFDSAETAIDRYRRADGSGAARKN